MLVQDGSRAHNEAHCRTVILRARSLLSLPLEVECSPLPTLLVFYCKPATTPVAHRAVDDGVVVLAAPAARPRFFAAECRWSGGGLRIGNRCVVWIMMQFVAFVAWRTMTESFQEFQCQRGCNPFAAAI